MSIATTHPQYQLYSPRWTRVMDALMDEDAVKAKGVAYLPKTGGMIKNDINDRDYNAFKMRARFPEVTAQALTGIVGLVFEKSPEGINDEVITNTGQNNEQLAREVVRAVAGRGRDILVVDAPRAPAGGTPFISRYSAESLINWKIDETDPGNLRLAVLKEDDPVGQSEYGHETREVYRKYERVDGSIWVSRWEVVEERDVLIDAPVRLPVPFMPIVIPGSIDLKPDCDPIPLLPVARCAFAYYLKSASYEHGLYLTSQPTPTITGVDQDQYDKIREQGYGSSSLWFLGENGIASFLQAASDPSAIERAMIGELRQAESYAVRLTQDTSSPESGKSLAMRAASQHASIYSMADSVSLGITRAVQMRAQWEGVQAPEAFALRTEYADGQASEQMINALNSAVNAGNAPRSALFEVLRRAGVTDLDDEAIIAEIRNAAALGGPPSAPRSELDRDAA